MERRKFLANSIGGIFGIFSSRLLPKNEKINSLPEPVGRDIAKVEDSSIDVISENGMASGGFLVPEEYVEELRSIATGTTMMDYTSGIYKYRKGSR